MDMDMDMENSIYYPFYSFRRSFYLLRVSARS